MPTYTKEDGEWKLITKVWQKLGEAWVEVPYIGNRLGGWKEVHVTQGVFVFVATLSSNVQNYNMRVAAVAAGWDTVAPLVSYVTVQSGVVVSSSSDEVYAFNSGSTFPNGSSMTLTVNGSIFGVGGAGGKGSGGTSVSSVAIAVAGQSAGPALFCGLPTVLKGTGAIRGGGGGGGGGAALLQPTSAPLPRAVMGGGGGAGGQGPGTLPGGVGGAKADGSNIMGTVDRYLIWHAGNTGASGSLTASGNNYRSPTTSDEYPVGDKVGAGTFSNREPGVGSYMIWIHDPGSGDVSEAAQAQAGSGGDGGVFGSSGASGGVGARLKSASGTYIRPSASALGGAGGAAIVAENLTNNFTGIISGAVI